MIRPPNRSVSAPIGMRPSEPTTTGTATSSDCWNELRCRAVVNFVASGLSSAHAQKLTAKPIVASASITPGRTPVRAGRAWVVLMSYSTARRSDVPLPGLVGTTAADRDLGPGHVGTHGGSYGRCGAGQ